jgi:hypothetical protein
MRHGNKYIPLSFTTHAMKSIDNSAADVISSQSIVETKHIWQLFCCVGLWVILGYKLELYFRLKIRDKPL